MLHRTTRRSHTKSRQGCKNCKVRHVKCDEKVPCGNCRFRSTICEYPQPAARQRGSDKPDVAISDQPIIEIEEPVVPGSRRLLELQLMSRWSAITYKTLTTPVVGDDFVWQRKVPEWSLKYDFVLNGVFALAAYEIASTSSCDRNQYSKVAHEYQDLALTSFRDHLTQVDGDSFESALCFSMMLMVLALASAQFTPASNTQEHGIMIQRTIVHYELVRGCDVVLQGHEDYIMNNPYLSKLKRFEELPTTTLEPTIELAISKLKTINEKRVTSTARDPHDQRLQQQACWKSCKTAMNMLEETFAKCTNLDYSGYILGWLNLCGSDYVEAIKSRDHIALVTLMFWGVLVDQLSDQVWWAKGFGASLVSEISHLEQAVDADANSTTAELIDLAQKLVQARAKVRANNASNSDLAT